MSNEGEEAIAGFFEDIPVLIVVVIATGIFLYSLVNGYVMYLNQLEHQRMNENAQELCGSIRNYDGLTDGKRDGVFLGDKLLILDMVTLEEDYDPDRLGYGYQISIIDTSNYPNSANFTKSFATSTPPISGSKYSITTSVLISIDDNNHAAQLIVTIWS